MPELAKCQCTRFNLDGSDLGLWCTAAATQEDLLCDECRKPCTGGIGGMPHQAWQVSDFVFRPRLPG